ncbi:MAG: molybdopterin molybdotransferase MoeA [Deltaproteobacteria bacterium]|nr:MAG: molybdopterin molybdotransferase MoeA [Deltaproteobacteria bacterium]
MIPVGEALARILEATGVLGAERTAILAALGRVAAEDVVSRRAVPAAPYSAMDGYAIRHADVSAAPARLRVVAVEPAGTVVSTVVEPGTAVKLFTGSVIPSGADAVVRIEDCEEEGERLVVRTPVPHGANIRATGEDVEPGQVVLARGTVLGPADVGVLASVGRSTVLVHQRPRVAILSTGSELIEVDDVPGPGQVVNSNAYGLAAAVREAGGEPVVLAIAPDRLDDIRASVAEAARADVVVSTGGVSVGDLDFVKDALEAASFERVFWRVAQKPGKPLLFGRLAGRHFFGLPGNPVSALVCFALYVRPALRRLQGHRRVHLPVVQARLAAPVRKTRGLTEFVRVSLSDGPDGPIATASRSQSSGVLTALGSGAGLLVGAAELPELSAGGWYPVVVAETTVARETPPF